MTVQRLETSHAVRPSDLSEVIVPVDGSRVAERALPLAEHLAPRVDAAVVPMTVGVAEPQWRLPEPTVAGVRDPVRLVGGHDVGREIALVAQGPPQRLVCMSSNGRGRFTGAVLGSVAQTVVRCVAQPVLLTGPSFDWGDHAEVTRILLCLDRSKLSEQMFPAAVAWAQDLALPMAVLHVTFDRPSPEEAELPATSRGMNSDDLVPVGYADRWATLARRSGVEAWGHHARGHDIAAEIVRTADRVPGTMIAMATHGRSGIGRVVMGSTAVRVLRRSPAPVLAMRANGIG